MRNKAENLDSVLCPVADHTSRDRQPKRSVSIANYRPAYRTGDPVKDSVGRYDIAPALDLDLVVPVTEHVINEPTITDCATWAFGDGLS